MASPTQSLATAVDGLLAETVAGALGPTPPKRKLDELGAACQSPNEASAAAEAAAEAAVSGVGAVAVGGAGTHRC